MPLPASSVNYYNVVNAMWPGLMSGQAVISPPRNGMDRFTGKMLQSWEHVEQSLEVMFATPFHERVLRRWVGSFVPHLLGESGVSRVITRFAWAIATTIDLWEPDYAVQQVHVMANAISTPAVNVGGADLSELFRQGDLVYRTEGVWYPRGHLGDFTPYQRASAGLVSRGGNFWDVVTLVPQLAA